MSTFIAVQQSEVGQERRSRRTLWSWLILVFSILTAIAWILPLWISVTSSVKSPAELASTSLWQLPSHLDFSNFTSFWKESDFTQKLMNSLLVSTVGCFITVSISFFNAVGLGLGRVKYSRGILTLFLVMFAVPQEALVFPVYKAAKISHLYGTLWPLAIILGLIYASFGSFLLGEVMRAVPKELVEAAHIDGAGKVQMMRHVAFPMLKPAMATLMVMTFIWNWNEYMMPLILLPSNDQATVPLAIAATFGQPGWGYTPDLAWGAAGTILSSAPTILFFLLFQRVIARGITIGRN